MYYVEVRLALDVMRSIDNVQRVAKVAGEKPTSTWACTCKKQGVVWAVPDLVLAHEMRQRLCDDGYDTVIETKWPEPHR